MTGTTLGPETSGREGDGLRRVIRDVIRYTPSGKSIPEETWRSRHRNILLFLVAHVPFLFVLGMYEGTESYVTGATIPAIPLTTVLLELGIIAGFALLSYWSRFGRRTRTALATTGLVMACGVLIHFSGGYIEAHFHFFVVMAVVAIYEDWFPFLLGIVYVAVQHGYFGMIDPSRVYNHSAAIDNPWAWAVIHAMFVLALAAALMTHWYSTERSREEAQEQFRAAQAKTEENDHLEATAEAYSTAMARAADGDLGVRLDARSESDAMTRIAEAFNEMMDETETAMEDIQTFAREVADASEEADAGTREVTDATEEVSEAIQEITGGAAEQREMLEEVSAEMNEMSATVEEVAASAETVAETSHETAAVADDGETTARVAIENAREVQDAIDSTVDNVEALDEQMAEIGDIVELISDIAEQTNMLALNANIEAARVDNGTGGDGGGFAVVADEVKQLADETHASAGEIEQLITEVQSQTETTAEEVQAAQRHVDDSVDAVQEVVDAFEHVTENAEATDTGVQEIRDVTDDQAASTEEATSVVEEVADISKTTADEVERVSAVAEEQTASMTQVSSNVGSLTEQAERLQTLLSTFEVDGTRT
jgi:methyl-accepting chemotaxis protein